MTPDAAPPPGIFRPERLLPLACIASAGILFASEFMTIFDLTPEGGSVLCAQNAASRHHFALGVIAIFAVIAVLVAVFGASKPAALAVGAAGIVALLLFLTIDLPKANNVGTLGGCTTTTAGSFFDAKAIPQAGFWLEMIGALGLALSGAALATMSPEQLETLRPGRRGPRRGESERPGEPPKPQRAAEPREATREKRQAAAGRRRT